MNILIKNRLCLSHYTCESASSDNSIYRARSIESVNAHGTRNTGVLGFICALPVCPWMTPFLTYPTKPGVTWKPYVGQDAGPPSWVLKQSWLSLITERRTDNNLALSVRMTWLLKSSDVFRLNFTKNDPQIQFTPLSVLCQIEASTILPPPSVGAPSGGIESGRVEKSWINCIDSMRRL